MEWLKTLGTVAPTIAAAIGGPLAGLAVKMATDALGIENSTSSLETAILSGSPDILLKMKEADLTFKVEMKKLGIELEQLHSEDRKSARSMATVNMVPQIVLSTIYTAGYFVVMWQFLTGESVIPVESSTALNMLLGVLTAAQVQIMNFYFGSSSGSKAKDAILIR